MTRVLQICPHDITPFGELCARYVKAAGCLDVELTTVFLAPAETQALDFAEYLDCTDLADTRELRRALRRYAGEPWDLVLCHRYRAYWAVVGSPLARQRCVVVAHEFGLMGGWQRRLKRRLFARKMRFAGVSPAVAAELCADVSEALVLPNVLDLEQADNELLAPDDALAALGLAPGGFTIGVVGRLHYKKRPALALRAFQAFLADRPDARLVFVGDGDQHQQLAARHNSSVHVLGNVPQAPRLFRAFDVLLHTTQVEAFGMVALEALFAGIPVVTLRQGGPEYVLGGMGVYAAADTAQAFADALHRAAVLDRAVLRQDGRARVQAHFSINALAQCLGRLLEDKTAPPHQDGF